MLIYGSCCKEKCIIRKVYETNNQKKRIEFCINKGCGYKQELPLTKEGK